MTVTPQKRAAFESPAALLLPTSHDPNMRRPSSIVVGAVLVWLRVAVGVMWLVSVGVAWPRLTASGSAPVIDWPGIDEVTNRFDLTGIALPVILVVGALAVAVEAVLALMVWRGVNIARVIIMILAVISSSMAFVQWLSDNHEIELQSTLLTVAVDILVLLSLSSRDAATYCRRNETLGGSPRDR